jgi:hypothetical protein
MTLEGPELEDFIQRFENCFGDRLSASAANEMYARLMELYRMLKVAAERPETQEDFIIEA